MMLIVTDESEGVTVTSLVVKVSRICSLAFERSIPGVMSGIGPPFVHCFHPSHVVPPSSDRLDSITTFVPVGVVAVHEILESFAIFDLAYVIYR